MSPGQYRAGEHSAVIFEGVHVDFPIYSAHGRSMKRSLLQYTTGGQIGLGEHDRVVVSALNNLSFRAEHGERIGLIGHNGAGKSTLLRTVAGVYEPVRGQISVTGKVSSLVDLTLGMDIEATGYENIAIRCLFLGLPADQIQQYADEIADVTELGEFLSMPIRTYSSGMLLRLAFAISTATVPDILLMDEWIGVGDATFVNRAQDRLKQLVGKTGILFIASHSDAIIKDVCTRAMWFDKGELRADGTPDEVTSDYSKWTAARG